MRDLYFAGAALGIPGGEIRYGHLDIDRFYLGYLAAFPDGVLSIDSAILNHEPDLPPRVALRWSLRGIHSGFGQFGPPTGASVYVMGMSHAWMVEGRIRMEWILIDEVAVWKQILAHVESRAGA